MRCNSHHQHRLTHRIREQARSHRGIAATEPAACPRFPCQPRKPRCFSFSRLRTAGTDSPLRAPFSRIYSRLSHAFQRTDGCSFHPCDPPSTGR
ncbi:hypothetical protein FHG55_27645 [Pseudomonas jessenii]|uniref:Uncharacterized protein n=1 Tax=Pseudomonas jessenii TaxID=77298 RepID=A0A5C4KQY7_PSEJE|nr:hypothetical protein FHG55_27645 [Pseudomonas jessenii]